LPIEKKLLIIKTVSHSLEILHKLGIVHGDLKLNNILIKRNDHGYYTTKLIDFDDSYFEFQPPSSRDEVVGDPFYYSPELEDYILNKHESIGSDLSCKSDIFALGIIFCQYLTGRPPGGVPPDKYPSHIVNNGGEISITNSVELPIELTNLVNSMLLKKANDRPSISEIFTLLKNISSKYVTSHSHSIVKDSASEPKTSTDKIKPAAKNAFERNVIKMNDRLIISMGFKKK
jgi:serine/threonine protein kinase